MARQLGLWAATLGVGWIPWAPGTWGSLLGLLLGLALAQALGGQAAWLVCVAAFVPAVFACTQAEKALNKIDPGQVVLDEVWAMALIVASLPQLQTLDWPLGVAFALFRLFDIIKPPPLKRLARLPGGWGIMADDAGAAVYVLILLWIFQ